MKAFENVSFITFNYDRCIEHFLWVALKTYYVMSDEEIVAILSQIPIFHPYGQVGRLNWQNGRAMNTPFGGVETFSGEQLLEIASQIKTFTERVEDDAMLLAMRKQVEEAETIVFLGFGYLDLNLRLIAPTKRSNADRVCGTAYNMSEPDRETVENDVIGWLKSNGAAVNIRLRSDLKCVGLFNEFWRSIPRSSPFGTTSKAVIKKNAPKRAVRV